METIIKLVFIHFIDSWQFIHQNEAVIIMFRQLKCRISVFQSDTFGIKTLNDLSSKKKKEDQAMTKRHGDVIIVLRFRYDF